MVFDLMGTVTDWASSIQNTIVSITSDHHNPELLQSLVADWRRGFFNEIHRRFYNGESQEDIDVTHRRILNELLQHEKYIRLSAELDEERREQLVQSWHYQTCKHRSISRQTNC